MSIPKDQSILLIPTFSDVKHSPTLGDHTRDSVLSSTFGDYPFSPSILRKQDEMEIFKTDLKKSSPSEVFSTLSTSDSQPFCLQEIATQERPVFNTTTCEVENSGSKKWFGLSSTINQSILLLAIFIIALMFAILLLTSSFETRLSEIEIAEFTQQDSKSTKIQDFKTRAKISLKVTKVKSSSANVVYSAKDVHSIMNSSSVTVYSLVDDILVIEESALTNFESVNELEIVGPISEDWLQYLLTILKNIQSLSLDIDKLCIGSKMKDLNSLRSMKLEKLKVLNMVNSHICLLANWVYSWDAPALTSFTIKNSDITKLNSKQMNEFVHKNARVLKSVSILNCFVCDTCALPEPHEGLEIAIEKAVQDFD